MFAFKLSLLEHWAIPVHLAESMALERAALAAGAVLLSAVSAVAIALAMFYFDAGEMADMKFCVAACPFAGAGGGPLHAA